MPAKSSRSSRSRFSGRWRKGVVHLFAQDQARASRTGKTAQEPAEERDFPRQGPQTPEARYLETARDFRSQVARELCRVFAGLTERGLSRRGTRGKAGTTPAHRVRGGNNGTGGCPPCPKACDDKGNAGWTSSRGRRQPRQRHEFSSQRSEFCEDGVHVVDEREDEGDKDNQGDDPVAEIIQHNHGRDGDGKQQDEPGACFSYVSLIH